jgi:Flp pilus assembly protein TadD
MLNKINISSNRKKLIVYLILTVVTFAVFWQVNQFDFINLDDNVYVTENLHIQSGITLDGFRWAFSTTYAQFWHPLTWLSLMFDYQLYGLNAGGYHLTNLILHVLSTLLLFWLFNRMTGAIWPSAFVAAFFALHPLHVESVAWIAERKDVLSAFFWMLTLCLYVYYTEKPVIKRYLLVIFSFVCALMSKPMVITLPVVMILLDYWPLGRLLSNDHKLSEIKIAGIIPLWQLWEKIPFFVFSAFFSIITLYAKNKPFVKHFPLGLRIANAPISFMTYLEKTFWPHDLAVFYPFCTQIPLWQVLGATILIIIISAAVIVTAKHLPYLFVGWLWYAITLLPVIGIIQIGNFAMADRFAYLPSIGIAVMIAWSIPLLFTRENTRKKIIFPAAIAFLTIMSILTWKQCGYWKNSITLFSYSLQVTKDNALAHNNLGTALFAEGKVKKAIEHFDKAISITSDYIFVFNNRGAAYANLGQYQKAIEDYNQTIRLKPDDAGAYYNKGLAYIELRQYLKAINDFNKAISLDPNYARAYNNRGLSYDKLGQYQKAIDDFNKAISLIPYYTKAYINRCNSYLSHGNKKLGCNDAKKACEFGSCKILETAESIGDCH